MKQDLIFKNYKEPLRPIPAYEGHGYYGVILESKDHETIQCHICGKMFKHLAAHIQNSHKEMSVREYREKFGLAYGTSLVSESMRWELKNRTLEWIKTLTPEQKAEMKRNWKKAIEERKRNPGQPKMTLETKNKRGVCPDQLLAKIVEVSKKLGRTPSKLEFIQELGTQKYTHKIYDTFGSWSKAVELAGLEPVKRQFVKGKVPKYDDDYLLELLVLFTQENNQIPTSTDFRNGLLPDISVYVRHFGSLQKARELAGVEEWVEERTE